MDIKIKQILDQYPFLSYVKFKEDQYLGIILNSDNSLSSMYVLDRMPSEEVRKIFLQLGEEWWWGSNRTMPINIFFKEYFDYFAPYILHFNSKEFNIEYGPTVSLQESLNKRIRRKQITLKKKS